MPRRSGVGKAVRYCEQLYGNQHPKILFWRVREFFSCWLRRMGQGSKASQPLLRPVALHTRWPGERRVPGPLAWSPGLVEVAFGPAAVVEG
jgi:hypothetical protein